MGIVYRLRCEVLVGEVMQSGHDLAPRVKQLWVTPDLMVLAFRATANTTGIGSDAMVSGAVVGIPPPPSPPPPPPKNGVTYDGAFGASPPPPPSCSKSGKAIDTSIALCTS